MRSVEGKEVDLALHSRGLLGKFPPGKFSLRKSPPGKLHPENFPLGKLPLGEFTPPRKIRPQGKFPPLPPVKFPLENSPPRKNIPWKIPSLGKFSPGKFPS